MKYIHGLHFNNIRGDIYGGLTAAVVALPLALAFGVSSGAGPVAGIYGAIFVGFFAALFGGTPAQVSGPTGPMTVVMAVIFTQYTSMFPDDPAHGAALAFTVVVMGGLFQILFGVLKIGKYINLVPHPVTSGFMSGIGVIIILMQLIPFFGHEQINKPLLAAQALPGVATSPVPDALILGLITLAIVYFLPNKINKLLPSPLFSLIVGTILAILFFQQAPILGDIKTGLPNPQIPVIPFNQEIIISMVKSALILAFLGTIDSLLTSLVADNITRTHHESDRELIGQGIGNTVAGLFGGLPGAGATMRTVINVRAGGQTPISGALHALILLAIVLGAGGFAKYIPDAVLAGILIKVGTDIVDWDYLKRIRSAPKAGVVIMFVVFFVTVFVDLISAVGLGMVMASFLFLKRMSDLQIDSITVITEPNEEATLTELETTILKAAEGRILLYHMEGPLSFGAAKGMIRRLAKFDEYDALILDMTDVPAIDFTSCRAIDDMVSDALQINRNVFLVGVRPKVKLFLQRQGVTQKLDTTHICKKRKEALCLAAMSLGIEHELCK
jgi:SulP family sulfate permease